uniref:Tail fiber protein n=2 Tax=unclassified bacterial viruses TaxID=12333 RepID=A0AAU6VY81_9VIRU
MDLIKYDMTDIWAVAGDVVAPDSAKIRAGWGVEVVPRQWWNWFENRQDQNIAYMLQKGIPEWDATTEYVINKSYVQRNGVVYRATATSTNSDPVALLSWVKAFSNSTAASEALSTVTPAADTMPYFTSASAADTTALTAFGRSIAALVDEAAGRTLFSAQLANSNLTALSGVAGNTNVLPYFTSTTTMSGTTLTSFARTLLDDVDAATVRLTLGLTTAATSELMSSSTERNIAKIMRVGAFGLGSFLDLRTHIYGTGVPSDCFAAGTVFGFANGGTGTSGMNIPGLTGVNYGTLQVNGQYSDASGLSAMSRTFTTTNGRTFVQTAASASAWGTWVESWTTGNLVKTASNVDTTVGRMLKVGDFGVGSQGILVGDINALTSAQNGFYKLGTPYTGGPLAGTSCTVIHQGFDAEKTQIAIVEGATTVRTFIRKYHGGTSAWQPWVELYHTGNSAALVAQVTADIQPTLNTKVNKGGDTMTGQLQMPSLNLVGAAGDRGYITMKRASSPYGYDAVIEVSAQGTGGDAGGLLSISCSQGVNFSGRVNAPAIVTSGTVSATGNITGGNLSTAGTVTGAYITSTGNVNAASNVTASGSVQASGNVTSANGFNTLASNVLSMRATTPDNSSNVHLWFYNYNQTERGLMYVGNDGSFHFRHGTGTEGLVLNASGASFSGAVGSGGRVSGADVLSTGNLYAGGGTAIYGTNGDVNGSAWGGWLSNWVQANFLNRTNGDIRQNAATYLDCASIGGTAFLGNVSGTTFGPNNLLGSGLLYASTNSTAGGTAAGTWRCHGYGNNGGFTVWQRVA